VAPMLIRIVIDQVQPLAGTATTEGRDQLRFEGWLELLRVLSELVAPATAPLEGRAAEAERPVSPSAQPDAPSRRPEAGR
jgi:hypothetical protein